MDEQGSLMLVGTDEKLYALCAAAADIIYMTKTYYLVI